MKLGFLRCPSKKFCSRIVDLAYSHTKIPNEHYCLQSKRQRATGNHLWRSPGRKFGSKPLKRMTAVD